MKEVEVDKFLDSFPKIKDRMNKADFCTLKYDFEKEKFVNSIQERVFNGPCNEEVINRVVSGLEVEENDVFSSFLSLEKKVMNFTKENKKVNKTLVKSK